MFHSYEAGFRSELLQKTPMDSDGMLHPVSDPQSAACADIQVTTYKGL